MSRSTNYRSRYTNAPEHIRVSLSKRDSGIKNRERDSRARGKRELQVLVQSITLGGKHD